MKKTSSLFLIFFISLVAFSQKSSSKAKTLLDEVSAKMGAYKNMYLGFSSRLINEDAGLNDDPPIRGNITLQGQKYNLHYLGNNFIFDGKTLVVINNEDKEINISSGNQEDESFVSPSKLLTFYKKGYNLSMGKLENIRGRKVQFINLIPIDSNSDIEQVQMGIDAKTKHIYKLVQIGKNKSKTIFTITKFKSDQPISKKLFTFDKTKYIKAGFTID